MNNFFASVKHFFNRKQFKYGGYAAIVTIVGIAIIVLANIGLTSLENTYDLRIDTTQNKKYTISEATKKVADGLQKDIYIYTLYATGSQDKDITEILQKIKGLSGHIFVENKDPDLDPRFMQTYTKNGQTIAAGSIIVSDKDGKLFRVLDQYAQYSYTMDQTTGQTTPTQIKVEGSVATAMNYINLGYMPTAFVVQGHGELTTSELGDISASMSDQNYNLEAVNIAQSPDKLKAGDIIMFFNPKTDISDAERDILKPLMLKGGRFFFLLDPLTTNVDKMPNLVSLLKLYDISLKSGIIFESDSAHMYSPSYPNVIVPDIQSHDITTPFSSNGIPMLIRSSGALKLPDAPPDSTMTITSLLKTSDKSYLKKIDPSDQNPDITQQATDEVGPFDVAAAVEKKNGGVDADTVRFVLVYNTEFVTSTSFTANTSNLPFFLYSAAWMRNAEKDIFVSPKLLSTAYFNIKNAAQFWVITVFSIGFIPVLMLVVGIIIYLKRKHL